MTAPNRNALWGEVLADELASGGLDAACISPGSRSTPLTVAFAAHPEIAVYSHLDERSAAFFALGRARRTGEPTALVCTSGTATANFHPAIVEADQGRVPLLALTADRPAELRDSGANQTVNQVGLYGDAVRWDADLPEPEADERKIRMLRTTAARALLETTGTPSGPVHLDCPFRKPLEPIEVPGDVPEGFEGTLAAAGRDGPFVRTVRGTSVAPEREIEAIATALESAARPLFVAGPADPPGFDPSGMAALANALGAPILADPLSDARFGPHVGETTVCGGYDAYLGEMPEPDAVVRVGASPTSKPLRHFLRDADCRQFIVDPAGGWREATFTATDLVVADPERLLESVADRVDAADGGSVGDESTGSESAESGSTEWLDRFRNAERRHWAAVDEALEGEALAANPFEGSVLSLALEHAPDPSTVFVSNSMPIRDADRFGRPRAAELTVLGNRGASGIDGIASTALGAGSATDDPLVLVTGDLAFYHDLNGLLAIDRCGVDATIVLVDNDGGGIFHKLPIEAFDPPFTEQFETPHGIEFEPVGDLYDLEFDRVELGEFVDAYRDSLASEGTQVLALEFDAAASHRVREGFER